MPKANDLAATTLKVHALLKDFDALERQRVVSAVMTLFGDQAAHPPSHIGAGAHAGLPAGGKLTQSLASYLSAKQASSNQVKRFLATADWLRQKGTSELSTALVSKTLRDNHQSKLTNAAECLNKNAAKGFVEKDGKRFFITSEGLTSLGHTQ